MQAPVDEVFGTTPKEKAIGAALVVKEDMSPEEADALDWQAYNKKKLVMMRSKDLQAYERRNFEFRTRYDGKQVFATETRGYKTNTPVNGFVLWMTMKHFANVGQIGVRPLPGSIVRDGLGGAPLPEVSIVPLALINRPGLQGCNTRNEPWPSAVITIGVARTLPELIEDSKYYFTDPSSLVSFCLGIKVYCPTRQMVAFLRERDPDDGGTAKLTWALSFGTQPIGKSSIDVLAREGISQVLGLDLSCTGPGIAALKLLLKKERFFAPFPDDLAREVVPHMEKDVVLDFHDVQQWCLGGLNDDIFPEVGQTREEVTRACKGNADMFESAGKRTGLFAFYTGQVAPPPEPAFDTIDTRVPPNLKPVKFPVPVPDELVERVTRFSYLAKLQDKKIKAAFKAARAREEGASGSGADAGNAGPDGPSRNKRCKSKKYQ